MQNGTKFNLNIEAFEMVYGEEKRGCQCNVKAKNFKC